MILVGIDEVGRGCWAGPLVAGAVILDAPIPGLTDSKRLSRFQRQRLSIEIYEQAAAVGLGWVEPGVIDEIGLTAAVRLAMRRALAEIKRDFDLIIIDGNYNFLSDNSKARAVIKADASVPAVSAASIVAKVARDEYMARAAIEHPDYHFEKHVGYGTAAHLAQLKLHGVCTLHRLSYRPIQAIMRGA